ncbi:MAG: 4'-phosphopantetheinyl transferase superfamily protein [Atribacterota bacterium]|nr:4'-phosphopantetheinyl transferase superfamily protein [Atribacterota bacterium]
MKELDIVVGVDLVEIKKIRDALLRFGERFLNRIFEGEELDFYAGKGEKRFQEGVAALFASKEAVKKLFLQREEKIGWKEIKVLHTSLGKPVVKLSPPFDGRFQHISLSISHSCSSVVAVTVAWGEVE